MGDMSDRPDLDEFLLPGISRLLRRIESKMATLQDLLTTNTSDIATLTGLVGQVVAALSAGGSGAPTQAQLDQLAAANSAVEKANADLTAALAPKPVPAPVPAPVSTSGGIPFTQA